MRLIVFALAVALIVGAGCSRVTKTPGAHLGTISSAFLIAQDQPPSEADLAMKKALEARGLAVTIGSAADAQDADVVVKYKDRWIWDIDMYLRSLDITFMDGGGQRVLATARWSDTPIPYLTVLFPLFVVAPAAASSPPRQQSLEHVAADLIAEAFTQLGVRVHEGPPAASSP